MQKIALAVSLAAFAACASEGGGDSAIHAAGAGGTGQSGAGSGGSGGSQGGTGTAGSGAGGNIAGGNGGASAGAGQSGTGGAMGGAAGTGGSVNPLTDGGPSDADLTGSPALTHTFDSIAVAAGQEITGVCQSWTLNNDTPLLVNAVTSSNQGYFHHSNWIWVPDNLYTGADGTWNCADRGFEQVSAGAVGGVFFAQSTQSKTDTQAFAPGVAFQMPAHARIIGDLHLLNASTADAMTNLGFGVYTIPPSDLKVGLQPMAFTNTSLDIVAHGETHARMQCNVPQPNFNVYYVLPHFHVLGQALQVDVIGGPMDGTMIFRSDGAFGEPQGRSFDPPIAVTGATALRVTCEYQNNGSATVHYGEGGQEMCVALLYSDGGKAGGTTIGNLSTTDTGGIHTTDGLCVAVGAPGADQ